MVEEHAASAQAARAAGLLHEIRVRSALSLTRPLRAVGAGVRVGNSGGEQRVARLSRRAAGCAAASGQWQREAQERAHVALPQLLVSQVLLLVLATTSILRPAAREAVWMSQRVAPARSAQSKPTQTVSTRQLGQASARPAQSIVDRVQDILQWNSERKKCPASPASPSVVEAECKRVVQLNHGERIAGVPGIIGMAGLIFSNMTSRNFLSATLFQIPTDRSMYFTLLLWTTSPRPSPDPKPQQRTRLISTTSIGSHRGLVQESLCAAAELRGSALPPALGLTSRL